MVKFYISTLLYMNFKQRISLKRKSKFDLKFSPIYFCQQSRNLSQKVMVAFFGKRQYWSRGTGIFTPMGKRESAAMSSLFGGMAIEFAKFYPTFS